MKRVTILILLICFIFLSACETKELASEETSDQINDVQGQKDELNIGVADLPEKFDGTFFTHAVHLDSGVVLAGTDEDVNSALCLFDLTSLEIRDIDWDPSLKIVDMCSCSTGFAILAADDTGVYRILHFDDNCRLISDTLAWAESVDIEHPFEFRICGRSVAVQDTNYIRVVDESGLVSASLGPYLGAIYVRNSDSDTVVISCKDGTTVFECLDERGNLNERFAVDAEFTAFYDSSEQGVLYALASGVIYCLDYEEGEYTEYANILATGSGSQCFIHLGDGKYFTIKNGTPAIWNPLDGSSLVKLTMATYGMSDELYAAVNLFNSSGSGYYIEVMDYASIDTTETPGAGLAQLNLDILSGNMPDIFDLSRLPSRLYASRGMLEELSKYIVADMGYDSLVTSVVDTIKNDGKIYEITPFFKLTTVCGSRSIAENDWTLDGFFNLISDYQAEKVFGQEITSDTFLAIVLTFLGDTWLVDYENAECRFEDELFIKILEFAGQLPNNLALNTSGADKWSNVSSGNQLLSVGTYGRDLISELVIDNILFHGDVSYMSFPSCNGGAALIPELWLGMSSQSTQKDGVWEFFKFTLSPELTRQEISIAGKSVNNSWVIDGLPLVQEELKYRLECQLESSRKPVTLNAYCNGSFVPIGTGNADDTTIDMALELVASIDRLGVYDSTVYSILCEEAAYIFSGIQDAQNVAMTVQSRVQRYLSEQYG
ncbi:MAG: extracellular solute-binding protein [Oscillospiraceae bacterium]|nr:extracellular solute-binding protein [Oscillospiraceae bacterium]